MNDETSLGEQPSERLGEPSDELPVNVDTKPPQRKARGKRRMREIAASNEAVRAQLEVDILAEIGGGTPSILHRVAAEALAAAVIAGRKLRAKGQSDADAIRQVSQLARAFNLKPTSNAPAAPLTVEDRLRLRGYAPPAPASSPDAGTDEEEDQDA
jgi:hypothetical protein